MHHFVSFYSTNKYRVSIEEYKGRGRQMGRYCLGCFFRGYNLSTGICVKIDHQENSHRIPKVYVGEQSANSSECQLMTDGDSNAAVVGERN